MKGEKKILFCSLIKPGTGYNQSQQVSARLRWWPSPAASSYPAGLARRISPSSLPATEPLARGASSWPSAISSRCKSQKQWGDLTQSAGRESCWALWREDAENPGFKRRERGCAPSADWPLFLITCSQRKTKVKDYRDETIDTLKNNPKKALTMVVTFHIIICDCDLLST